MLANGASEDNKILKFNYPGIEILVLKSGSWRENIKCQAGFEPLLSHPVDSFAFLHGALHWLVQYEIFLWFHLVFQMKCTERYTLLEPMLEKVNSLFKHGVLVLGGMLCFYYAHDPYKLWVMKDYGVKHNRYICLLMVKCCYSTTDV